MKKIIYDILAKTHGDGMATENLTDIAAKIEEAIKPIVADVERLTRGCVAEHCAGIADQIGRSYTPGAPGETFAFQTRDRIRAELATQPIAPTIPDVQRLRLEPGDRIVLSWAGKISHHVADALIERMEKLCVGHKVIILDGGLKMSVLSEKPVDEAMIGRRS